LARRSTEAQGARSQTSSKVTYEKGCELLGDDRSGFPEAVAAAAQADVAVVVLGGRSGLHKSSTVGEARDATDLRLSGVQEELVAAVAATGTPTVLVVMSGRAHVLSDVADRVQALLVAAPLGEQGGNALADVVLGRAEPTGRLAVTLSRSTGQMPLYSSHRSGAGVRSFMVTTPIVATPPSSVSATASGIRRSVIPT